MGRRRCKVPELLVSGFPTTMRPGGSSRPAAPRRRRSPSPPATVSAQFKVRRLVSLTGSASSRTTATSKCDLRGIPILVISQIRRAAVARISLDQWRPPPPLRSQRSGRIVWTIEKVPNGPSTRIPAPQPARAPTSSVHGRSMRATGSPGGVATLRRSTWSNGTLNQSIFSSGAPLTP